jgi:hypothetical protein
VERQIGARRGNRTIKIELAGTSADCEHLAKATTRRMMAHR